MLRGACGHPPGYPRVTHKNCGLLVGESMGEPLRLADEFSRWRGRDLQAKCRGGLDVERQLELRGLLHRQVARPGALEDPVHETRSTSLLDCASGLPRAPARQAARSLARSPARARAAWSRDRSPARPVRWDCRRVGPGSRRVLPPRIAEDGRDDGDRPRRSGGGPCRRGAGDDDHVDIEGRELTRQARLGKSP